MNPALDLTPDNQLHRSVAHLIARAIHHYKMGLEQSVDIEVFKAKCWLIEASTLERLINRVSKLENDMVEVKNVVAELRTDMQHRFDDMRSLILRI